jgi:hypothetical protein
MHSMLDPELFSNRNAENFIKELGVLYPQKRFVSLFFNEAGSAYPNALVLKYSEEVTKDIFKKCNLPYLSQEYYERSKEFGKKAAEEIWTKALSGMENYFLVHKVQAS